MRFPRSSTSIFLSSLPFQSSRVLALSSINSNLSSSLVSSSSSSTRGIQAAFSSLPFLSLPATASATAFLLPSKRNPPTTRSTRLNMSTSSNTNDKFSSRVALLQFKVTPSKSQNHETAKAYLAKAHAQSAKLVVLPEIWNGPYATSAFAEYAEILPDLDYQYDPNDQAQIDQLQKDCPSVKVLLDAAIQYKMYIVGGSISEKVVSGDNDGDVKIYNTCLCIDPSGKIVGKHSKVHLFDIDVKGKITFKESDTLSPGQSLTSFNAGDVFGNIGVGICYDIRFPEYALLLNKKYQCNILIYPGAFNLTTGPAHWELLQRGRAVDNQCFVLTASPARTTEEEANAADDDASASDSSKYPHYTAWGHSTAVSPWGTVVGKCEEGEDIVVVDLDMDEVKNMREGIPTSLQKRDDLYKLIDG